MFVTGTQSLDIDTSTRPAPAGPPAAAGRGESAMRRVAMSMCLVAAGALLAAGEVTACGDKLLVLGRHARSQRVHGAIQHGSILVFLDEGGHLQTALREMGLQRDLELAGHSVRIVSDPAKLVAEIRSRAHDVLIADVVEAAALGSEVLATPGAPALLPVVVNPTGDEWAEAAARSSCIRQSPSVGKHYLAVIDEAIVQRRARQRARERQ